MVIKSISFSDVIHVRPSCGLSVTVSPLLVIEVFGLVQRPSHFQGGVGVDLEGLGQNVSDIGYDLRDHQCHSHLLV